jgi:hypothetical protein
VYLGPLIPGQNTATHDDSIAVRNPDPIDQHTLRLAHVAVQDRRERVAGDAAREDQRSQNRDSSHFADLERGATRLLDTPAQHKEMCPLVMWITEQPCILRFSSNPPPTYAFLAGCRDPSLFRCGLTKVDT